MDKKNIETPHYVYNMRVLILLLLFWSGGERLGDWCKNANGQDHYTQCGSAAHTGRTNPCRLVALNLLSERPFRRQRRRRV